MRECKSYLSSIFLRTTPFDLPWGYLHSSKKMRDMQIIDGDKVLVSISTGYIEIDLATGKEHFKNKDYKNIESARRLANGNTILSGNDDGIFIYELSPNHEVLRQVHFPNLGPVRLLRSTPQGTFFNWFRH